MLRSLCRFILFLPILFLQSCSDNSQSIRVSNSGEYGYPNEPSIAVNPHNTGETMIAANINCSFYSSDGGASWASNYLTDAAGVWGDFTTVCDTNGNFFLFHLSSPEGYKKKRWLDRIVCQLFDKQMKVWHKVSYLGDTLSGTWKDKPTALVNRATNEIVVAWTEFDSLPGKANNGSSRLLFSTSADDGKTWAPPVRINQITGDASLGDSTATAVSLCVNKAGDYFSIWPRLDTIWMNRFDHISRTWKSGETFVAVQPGGWRFFLPGLKWCNGWPSINCDFSDSVEKLVVCWGAKPNDSTPSAIYLSTSTDEGLRWSFARQISSGTKNANLFFPAMRIDETSGTYGILAYESAADDQQRIKPVLFTSHDKATSFNKADCLSEYFMADSSVFLGDYISLEAQKGFFYPVWTSIFLPISEIRFTKIPVGGCIKK